jgi:hypothetical protein
MLTVKELLDSLNNPRLSIVETGCEYTGYIAEWVASHPESTYNCVDLNFSLLLRTHRELEENHTARYCTFRSQDHEKWLLGMTWLDAAFLTPESLAAGLGEFGLAMSAGAKLIVMSDYQGKSAWAIKQAKEFGWAYIAAANGMNVLRRP